jgi:hypothetical protein
MTFAALTTSSAKISPIVRLGGLQRSDGYEYGAATVYHEGKYYRFYCSVGGKNANEYIVEHPDKGSLAKSWDYIRMRTSTDGAVWSAPRVVLVASKGNKETCACDPAIVRGSDGYWYLYYAGYTESQHTVTYVARSANIYGPFEERYVGNNKWERYPSNPKQILYPKENLVGDGYGSGQVSVVKVGSTYHFWFTDMTKAGEWKSVHIESSSPYSGLQNKTRKTITFNGVSKFTLNDFGDVKWNGMQRRFEMWITRTHFNLENSIYIDKYVSTDGNAWTMVKSVGPFTFAANVGMSGDADGWIVEDKTLVSFGAPEEIWNATEKKVQLLSDSRANALKEEKKRTKAPIPGMPWTMYQFIDNIDGDGFGVSAASIIASGKEKNVNYYQFPIGSLSGKKLEFIAGDFDGDGVTDIGAVDRNSARWYIMSSLTGTKREKSKGKFEWGWQWPGLNSLDANLEIVLGDFDGDGKTDPAVVNKFSKTWYIYSSKSAGESALVTTKKEAIWDWPHYKDKAAKKKIGEMTHVLSGDYDGDGKSDIGAVDCSMEKTSDWGCRWYILSSKTGELGVEKFPWGWLWSGMTSKHIVVEGDFDGDGKADPTIVDNINAINGKVGNWYSLSSRSLGLDAVYDPVNGYVFGWNMDGLDPSRIPIAGDFNGDGIADRSMVSKDILEWNANVTDEPRGYFGYSLTYFANLPKKTNYQYLVGDYDGDGVSDCVIADPTNARIYYYTSLYKNSSFSRPIYHINLTDLSGALYKSHFIPTEPSVDEQKIQAMPKTLAKISTKGLNLIISDMNLGSEIGVYNAIGQRVFRSKAGSSEVKIQLPSKGMYVVRVGTQSSVVNVK